MDKVDWSSFRTNVGNTPLEPKIVLHLVCQECGGPLRDWEIYPGTLAGTPGLTLPVPLCDSCRTRAVNVAFLEGQEAAKER